MMELIWESKDTLTAIYRRGRSFHLIYDGHYVCPPSSYNFVCGYVIDEFCVMSNEHPFPAAA